MKYILSILLIFFSFLLCEEYEAIVYLKNGSVIHGTIIQEPGFYNYIKIKSENKVYVYQSFEIDKITRKTMGSINDFKDFNIKDSSPKGSESEIPRINEFDIQGSNTNDSNAKESEVQDSSVQDSDINDPSIQDFELQDSENEYILSVSLGLPAMFLSENLKSRYYSEMSFGVQLTIPIGLKIIDKDIAVSASLTQSSFKERNWGISSFEPTNIGIVLSADIMTFDFMLGAGFSMDSGTYTYGLTSNPYPPSSWDGFMNDYFMLTIYNTMGISYTTSLESLIETIAAPSFLISNRRHLRDLQVSASILYTTILGSPDSSGSSGWLSIGCSLSYPIDSLIHQLKSIIES